MIRHLLSFALCLMLVVTSHGTGMARGSERAVDQMVICAGTQTSVVYIDSDGMPTQAPHHCPDCALHGFDVIAMGAADLGPAPVFAQFTGMAPDHAVCLSVPGHAMARAPPRLI
ncbi:hypothetical protein ACERZ8_01050 [Tateyamaria armeniaca]|uniref:DUF2946 domain-containing protein n=1 Tax=Tateyamaria armeniaca TaxID=2518930 RepID=A0ABW8UN31_9RHOB